MLRSKGSRIAGVFITLVFSCFASSKAIEVVHPLEENRRDTHQHSSDEAGAALQCQASHQHEHDCLHHKSLAQTWDLLGLGIHLVLLGDSPIPFQGPSSRSTQDVRLRGPPSDLV